MKPSGTGHVTAFINYTLRDLTIGLQDRWISGYNLGTQPIIIYNSNRIQSQNYIDLNLARRFMMNGGNYTTYFTVQNLLNAAPPLVPNASGAPGLIYPTGPSGDIMGRYFTIGLGTTSDPRGASLSMTHVRQWRVPAGGYQRKAQRPRMAPSAVARAMPSEYQTRMNGAAISGQWKP